MTEILKPEDWPLRRRLAISSVTPPPCSLHRPRQLPGPIVSFQASLRTLLPPQRRAGPSARATIHTAFHSDLLRRNRFGPSRIGPRQRRRRRRRKASSAGPTAEISGIRNGKGQRSLHHLSSAREISACRLSPSPSESTDRPDPSSRAGSEPRQAAAGSEPSLCEPPRAGSAAPLTLGRRRGGGPIPPRSRPKRSLAPQSHRTPSRPRSILRPSTLAGARGRDPPHTHTLPSQDQPRPLPSPAPTASRARCRPGPQPGGPRRVRPSRRRRGSPRRRASRPGRRADPAAPAGRARVGG
jgi:hypothetical protein